MAALKVSFLYLELLFYQVLHMTSSSIVIQIIPTQWTDSESAKARSIIILEATKRDIRFPWFSWGRRPVFSELSFVELICTWRGGDGLHEGGGVRVEGEGGHLEMLSVPLSWVKNPGSYQAWEKQHMWIVLHLPLLFMPTLFQKEF